MGGTQFLARATYHHQPGDGPSPPSARHSFFAQLDGKGCPLSLQCYLTKNFALMIGAAGPTHETRLDVSGMPRSNRSMSGLVRSTLQGTKRTEMWGGRGHSGCLYISRRLSRQMSSNSHSTTHVDPFLTLFTPCHYPTTRRNVHKALAVPYPPRAVLSHGHNQRCSRTGRCRPHPRRATIELSLWQSCLPIRGTRHRDRSREHQLRSGRRPRGPL